MRRHVGVGDREGFRSGTEHEIPSVDSGPAAHAHFLLPDEVVGSDDRGAIQVGRGEIIVVHELIELDEH